MSMEFRLLLILTATIAPAVPVVRMDPQTRFHDYCNSLTCWWGAIRHLPVDIVWVENSGYPTADITGLIGSLGANDRIVVLQVATDAELVKKNGKGAGEALMLDSVARLFPLEGYSHIGKCTGRLWMRNASRLIAEYSDSNTEVWFAIRSDFHFVDTRFFLCSRRFFVSHFLGMASEANDDAGLYIEHIAAKRILKAIAQGENFGFFPDLPRYQGTGATDGKRHDGVMGAVRYFVKNSLHQFARQFAKWIYL